MAGKLLASAGRVPVTKKITPFATPAEATGSRGHHNLYRMRLCAGLPFLIIFMLLGSRVLAQTQPPSYRLTGTIDADTGTVVLLPIGGKEFDPNAANNYRAKIRQGKFVFDGQMAYPGGYLIAFFPNYVSSPFIIEAGKQTIVCHVDSIREIPAISNTSTREVSSVLFKKKAVLLDYTRQHPASYVAMWELVQRMGGGYEPILDSIYAALSPALKSTYTGQVIAKSLQSSKVTAIGQHFPTLQLVDTSNRPVSIPTAGKSTYTLVDFWFSHCGPCLSEFPRLKELFVSYQPKGFDIIGISIDKEGDVAAWKNVINEKSLTWNQYLDLAGKLTVSDLSIRLFPSNFLLDEKGVIIRKNISPAELTKFLSERL